MKGWLDKYGNNINANEGTSSAPEGWVGEGYSTKGRNYSPAWGGQFAIGGSLPGSVGFTYARTQGAAPSEGPYAKKTLPSAEHGMSYYQHGLDWKPRNISENGSLIPIAQTGFPTYTMPRASGESTSTGITSLQRLPELERQIDVAKKIAKQPQIKQGRESTPREDAERRRKNEVYASTLPNAQYNELTGEIERINPNRGIAGEAQNFMSRREDQKGEDALRALEIAGYLEGAGALGSLAKKAIGKKVAQSMESGLLSKLKGAPKPTSTFKSEIDWAKWNPETPNYPELINEYNAIEESTKKAGTWMKNADGSPFQGTPEQFIQQQSSWFKKAFPEYHGEILNHNTNAELNTIDESFFNKAIGDGGFYGKGTYTHPNKEYTKPYGKNNYEFYLNSKNKGFLDKSNIDDAEYFKRSDDEILQHHLPEYENRLMNYELNPNRYSDNAKEIWLNKLNEQVKAGKISRDKLDEFTSLHNPQNGEVVIPFNNRVKSAVGNVGFFDMANPNIYKSIISGLGLGALGKGMSGSSNTETPQQKKGGVVKDDMGYWNPNNWGKIVEINSPYITMKPHPITGQEVPPLIGISDTGDVQYMEPGKDYEFEGSKVREIPVAQTGRTLPAIYTDDPRKVKSYTDSLNLYKQTLKNIGSGWFGKPEDAYNYIVEESENYKKYIKSLPLKERKKAEKETSVEKNYPNLFKSKTKKGIAPAYWRGLIDVSDTDPSTWTSATSIYKKPVQPYILQKEPTLKKKVLKAEPIKSDVPIASPKVTELRRIDETPSAKGTYNWNVEYFDPITKKTATKTFATNKEAEQFYNNPDIKTFRKYSDVSGVGRFKKGGWLDKYN